MKKLVFLIILILLIATPAFPLNISVTNDSDTLVNSILGTGFSILGPTSYSGGDIAAGTFTGGLAAGLGFENGMMLTTGEAALMDGPNKNSLNPDFVPEILGTPYNDFDTYVDLGLAGDAQLTALSGYDTFDAAVLEFNFSSSGGDLFFNYVFGSEEYVNYVDSPFNDVFGFWVDGVNLAVVPGTDTPVSVNTINPRTNSDLFRNNIDYYTSDSYLDLVPGENIDVEFDGLTNVLTATYLDLAPGIHHMKIAIADASDGILDAGVFIQGGTFSDTPTSVPEPATLLLLGPALGGLVLFRRRLG